MACVDVMPATNAQQERANGSFSPEMAQFGVYRDASPDHMNAEGLNLSSSDLEMTLPASSTSTSNNTGDDVSSLHAGQTSRHFRPVMENGQHEGVVQPKLRLGNLPFVASIDDVRMFLMGFNIAEDANPIRILERQGQPTGRAIVKMASMDDAVKAAAALHHSELGKRCIDVTVVQPNQGATTSNNGTPNHMQKHNNNNRQMNRMNNAQPQMPPPFMAGMPPPGFLPHMMGMPGVPFPPPPPSVQQPNNYRGGGKHHHRGGSHGARGGEAMVPFWPMHFMERCVRLVGLPYSAREQDIVEFLSPFSAFRVRFERTAGRLTGKAVVELQTKEIAQQVVADKNKEYMGKRFIEVYPARQTDLQCAESELRIAVRLRGLPYTATCEDVCEFFGMAGLHCTYVALQHAPERNRERREGGWGEAWGLFASELETQSAHRLYGQRVGDRWIELKVCSLGDFRQEMQASAVPIMAPILPPPMGPMGMPPMPMYGAPMGPPQMFGPPTMYNGPNSQSSSPSEMHGEMPMSMSLGGYPMSNSGSMCGTPPPPPLNCGHHCGDDMPMPPMPLTHSIGLALPSCVANCGCQCPECTQGMEAVEMMSNGWGNANQVMMGGIGTVMEEYNNHSKAHLSAHFNMHDLNENSETVSTSTSDVASDAITTEPPTGGVMLHDKLPQSESRISTHDPYALPPDSEPATPVTAMTPATI